MLGNGILILGNGGSGKSTLAKEMGKTLSLEVIHLDSYYWKPNWEKPSDEEFAVILDRLLNKEQWIMDGNYTRTVYERGTKADVALFVEMPRIVSLYRIVKRRIMYRNRTRPDMKEGCNERLDYAFLKWVWTYPKRRDSIISELKRSGVEIVYIKGLKGMKQFKQKLHSESR